MQPDVHLEQFPPQSSTQFFRLHILLLFVCVNSFIWKESTGVYIFARAFEQKIDFYALLSTLKIFNSNRVLLE